MDMGIDEAGHDHQISEVFVARPLSHFDHDAALMAPPVFRQNAQVVRLNRFTPQQVQQFHKEMQSGG